MTGPLPLRGSEHPLRGTPVAVIDVETTGLEATARVVQLAVVYVDQLGVTEPRVVLDTLVNPGIPIPAEATKQHGITTDQVAGAPPFADVADRLLELVNGRVLAYFNAPYDHGRLNHELRLAKRPELTWDPVCGYVLARRVDKFKKGKRLADVAARRGIVLDAHGAAGDAVATAMLLPKLMREGVTTGNTPPTALRTRGSYASWQRGAALEEEADFARYLIGKGNTGPFDLAWHALEGLKMPDDIAHAQSKFAGRVGTSTEKCRSCNAPILWQVSRHGRPIPLDPAVIEVVVYDAGETDPAVHKHPLENLVDHTGGTVKGWRVPADVRPDLPRVRGRISHFATCPNANSHRRDAPASSAEEAP